MIWIVLRPLFIVLLILSPDCAVEHADIDVASTFVLVGRVTIIVGVEADGQMHFVCILLTVDSGFVMGTFPIDGGRYVRNYMAYSDWRIIVSHASLPLF